MALTDAQRAAIARSRAQAHAVKRYLTQLRASRHQGVSRARLEGRLARIREMMAVEADPQRYLELLREKAGLERALQRIDDKSDLEKAERAFVGAAKAYGDRKRLSYRAWRQAGVPTRVLRRAGITNRRG